MKTLLYNLFIIFLCLPNSIFAGNGHTGKYTKEKKIKKEYQVDAKAMLKIDNSYGNLYMTTWNEDRVVIEVHIKTNGNNEEKVKKKLDEIDVIFEANNSMVSAKTAFSKSKWNWNWGKSNNVNIEVNYTIKLPASNSVNLSNDYGGIYLDKLEGKASISCDYGKIEIGQLLSRGNFLKFDYTSKSSIDFVKGATIQADYSGYVIGKAENLIVKADYTSSRIKEVKNIEYKCDYGSISVDQLTNIQGNGSYLKTELGIVNGNVDINSDFSSIKIEKLTRNAGNVVIRSEYAGIKIGYAPEYSFNFEVKLDYAGLKSDSLEFTTKRSQNNQKYYKGFHGAENSSNFVKINSQYGGVSLKQI
ncbi:hypothetical protein [Ascidiimonas sp. W6]|uniref:hypothetical protein n=1 Tax=Ascidiimonas meishanensis TaxID=3128903 RepID=UPI0030EDAD8E